MIKLLMAIAVICVLMTVIGICYCYINGVDPTELEEDSNDEL